MFRKSYITPEQIKAEQVDKKTVKEFIKSSTYKNFANSSIYVNADRYIKAKVDSKLGLKHVSKLASLDENAVISREAIEEDIITRTLEKSAKRLGK